ncbi:MAG: hypothetical protein ACD_74C00028G0008 [uncultured bacterium]|nr:MAG: hypothetical protein ACD_74C00028G0008 [uncultured bacterium]
MVKSDKKIGRLKSKPKDFTWGELKTVLSLFDFLEIKTGKTSGSRVKFYNEKLKVVICMHKPHNPPYLKDYQIKQVLDTLENNGLT